MNSQTSTAPITQTSQPTSLHTGREIPLPSGARPKSNPLPASPVAGQKDVFFQLDAGAAREVLLAGDFTGWAKTPIKLRKGKQGTWRTTVSLAPGQYHYKFVVDGEWKDDPAAKTTCSNPFGTRNSVLEIS
jgi:1,4-alpha-glucan branching enzyme